MAIGIAQKLHSFISIVVPLIKWYIENEKKNIQRKRSDYALILKFSLYA